MYLDQADKISLTVRIMEAKLDELIDLSYLHHLWKDVLFDFDKLEAGRSDGAGFCWTAHYKSQAWKSIFPMQSSNYVKMFKTFNGAKRNFIRRL